jgi:hypothetical protein
VRTPCSQLRFPQLLCVSEHLRGVYNTRLTPTRMHHLKHFARLPVPLGDPTSVFCGAGLRLGCVRPGLRLHGTNRSFPSTMRGNHDGPEIVMALALAAIGGRFGKEGEYEAGKSYITYVESMDLPRGRGAFPVSVASASLGLRWQVLYSILRQTPRSLC